LIDRRVAPRGGVRRRLVVAFVLVAGIAAGALAVGSFFVVRESRLRASLERAEQETRFGLGLAAGLSREADLQQFVASFGSRGIRAVLHVDGERVSSEPGFNPPIPEDLSRLVGEGQIAFRRQTVDDVPFLVTGGRAARSEAELFFFFSEQGIRDDLDDLRNILVIGWLVVVVAAALVGRFVADRTLAPVGRASQAARSMAEGLLDTRLPAGGEDEFGSWAASFNEMAEALQAKIGALSAAQARERRFTSDVAHELRTPLTALVSEASVLREHLDRLPDEARRPAELLVGDVARLRRLVEDLMEISRLDAGQERVEAEPVDLASLAEDVVRARGWGSLVALHAGELVLRSDRRRLERIVANLVGNAVEHGGRDVSVRVGRDGTGPFVEVADGGGGIPPQHQPHLFERFYKVDPARSGGSGLGLVIAMENARLLGGDIEVWSEVGVGSRFTLRLPVTESLPPGDGAVAYEVDDEARTEERGGTS
jgi:signal transduction histidine kinase